MNFGQNIICEKTIEEVVKTKCIYYYRMQEFMLGSDLTISLFMSISLNAEINDNNATEEANTNTPIAKIIIELKEIQQKP